VRPDGSQRRQLTKLEGSAQAPAWSRDGRRLAFSANVEGSRFDIYTVRVNGQDAKPLTSRGQSFEPAWSPDGKTIVFSDAGAIVAIDVESGEERVLTDPEHNDSSPAWIPRAEADS
jgi:Tol biopolymer transport system component